MQTFALNYNESSTGPEKPWPRLFQNLWDTRETELTEDFPVHVVCVWIGNSQPVAAKHYLRVIDEHFARGARLAQQTTVLSRMVKTTRAIFPLNCRALRFFAIRRWPTKHALRESNRRAIRRLKRRFFVQAAQNPAYWTAKTLTFLPNYRRWSTPGAAVLAMIRAAE